MNGKPANPLSLYLKGALMGHNKTKEQGNVKTHTRDQGISTLPSNCPHHKSQDTVHPQDRTQQTKVAERDVYHLENQLYSALTRA